MQDKTKKGRDDNRVQDMEEESSDEDSDVLKAPPPPVIQPPLPPAPDKVLVKKYDPKQSESFLMSLFITIIKQNIYFSSESYSPHSW